VPGVPDRVHFSGFTSLSDGHLGRITKGSDYAPMVRQAAHITIPRTCTVAMSIENMILYSYEHIQMFGTLSNEFHSHL
jgi:hypothetical protein